MRGELLPPDFLLFDVTIGLAYRCRGAVEAEIEIINGAIGLICRVEAGEDQVSHIRDVTAPMRIILTLVFPRAQKAHML